LKIRRKSISKQTDSKKYKSPDFCGFLSIKMSGRIKKSKHQNAKCYNDGNDNFLMWQFELFGGDSGAANSDYNDTDKATRFGHDNERK
jgi:hypothetical protein